jgi:hypothetical protein
LSEEAKEFGFFAEIGADRCLETRRDGRIRA